MKDHIRRLPTVNFTEIVGNPTPEPSSTVALSIPLFASSFQFIKDGNSVERFRNIHCKGAIWTAIAFQKNTDLGENQIPVYFHIEDKVWPQAKPVFKEFNVPDDFICLMPFNKKAFPKSKVKNVRYGKKLMCLFDETRPMPTNWVIVDSDCFPCTTGRLMQLHEILTSDVVSQHPASIDYQMVEFEKEHWVNRICDAAGIVYKAGITEGDILQQLGLGILPDTEKGNRERLLRPRCKTTLFSIPTQHIIVDYIKSNFFTCCEDEFLLACFSLWSPFLDLSQMIDAPVVLSPNAYAQTRTETYFHHLIFDSENSNPYFTRFYRDIARHLPSENPYLKAFDKFHVQ